MEDRKFRITSIELWSLMLSFMLGHSMVLFTGYVAGHDAWISLILATCIAIFITRIYASLAQSYPGKSIVDIAELKLGKWVGKGIGILYAWYSLHLGSLVLRNFVDLTSDVILPSTPILVIQVTMMMIVAWVVYEGIQVMSRVAQVLLLFAIIATFLSVIFLLPDMDVKNITPIFESSWKSIWEGSFQLASFPLGETVLFAMIIPYLNDSTKAKKTVLASVLTLGFILLFTFFENVLVLGGLVTKLIYPAYTVSQYISIGEFIERVEPLSFMIWVFGGFAKIAVCLFVANLLIAKVAGVKEHKVYTIPIAILMIELSTFINPSQTDVASFANEVWPWYSTPFQILIPLFLLIIVKIKSTRKLVSSVGED